MNLNDVKIGTKMLVAFLLVAGLIIVVGVIGYQGTKKMKSASTVLDAALTMQLATRSDMQMIMEMLSAPDKEGLDAMWQEHEVFVKQFDDHLDVITDTLTDKRMARIVDEAGAMHDEEFQPRIKEIYELMISEYAASSDKHATMKEYEAAVDETMEI